MKIDIYMIHVMYLLGFIYHLIQQDIIMIQIENAILVQIRIHIRIRRQIQNQALKMKL
jgi:hypothetical protein